VDLLGCNAESRSTWGREPNRRFTLRIRVEREPQLPRIAGSLSKCRRRTRRFFRLGHVGVHQPAPRPKSPLPKRRRIVPDLRSFLGSTCLSKALVSAVEPTRMEDL
jgi:hypothetical protein